MNLGSNFKYSFIILLISLTVLLSDSKKSEACVTCCSVKPCITPGSMSTSFSTYYSSTFTSLWTTATSAINGVYSTQISMFQSASFWDRLSTSDEDLQNPFYNLSKWPHVLWDYELRPTLEDAANQLHALKIDQSRAIGSFFDAQEQVMAQKDFQVKQIEAHRTYRPSEMVCTVGTVVGGLQRVNIIRRSLERSWTTEQARVGGNTTVDAAVEVFTDKGPAKSNKERHRLYIERYCDVNSNRGVAADGCSVASPPSTAPILPDRDVRLTEVIFEPMTIDIRNIDTRHSVEALVRNIVEPNVEGLVHLYSSGVTTGDTSGTTAEKVMLKRRKMQAARQGIYDAVYHIISRRVPGSGGDDYADYIQDLRGEAGVTINVSDNPSYEEVMNTLLAERFRSGDYQHYLVDEPENIAKEMVGLQGMSLVQHQDFLDLVDRFSVMLATQVARDIRKSYGAGTGAGSTPTN